MKIYRPTKALVDMFIGIEPAGLPPRYSRRPGPEWDKNHRDFVLRQLLPEVQPPTDVWRVCAEAYLTDLQFERPLAASSMFTRDRLYSFEEVLCDGSTCVPDLAYRWGRIKDPWSMGHDLLCLLNKYDLPDVFGNRWYRNAADRMYRRGWYAQRNYIIGSIWWAGLFVGSWVPWIKKADCEPECKEFVNDRLPLCKLCRHDYMLGRYNPSTDCGACRVLWDTGHADNMPMVGSCADKATRFGNWRAVLRERNG